MNIDMYGIPNCDTLKKARRWLKEHDIVYTFHDYKKEGIDLATLEIWCKQVTWETLLNKRGTTWRKLSNDDKSDLNQAKVLKLLVEHTSMIKRPVLIFDDNIMVGFSEAVYAETFQ